TGRSISINSRKVLEGRSDMEMRQDMITRRNMVRTIVGAVPIAHGLRGVAATVKGVRIGVQSASFTFSGFNLDKIIQTMKELDLDHIDMMSEHVENYLGAPVDLPGTGRGLPRQQPTPQPKLSAEESARQAESRR